STVCERATACERARHDDRTAEELAARNDICRRGLSFQLVPLSTSEQRQLFTETWSSTVAEDVAVDARYCTEMGIRRSNCESIATPDFIAGKKRHILRVSSSNSLS